MKGLKKVPKSVPETVPVEVIEASPAAEVLPAARSGGGKEKLYCAVADNFDTILHLAGEIVSMGKMAVQSEITLKQMEAAREQLLAESKAYAEKKDADTRSVVARMEIIRCMMNDFYQHSSGNMTSEDFCKIITEIINQMGRLES